MNTRTAPRKAQRHQRTRSPQQNEGNPPLVHSPKAARRNVFSPFSAMTVGYNTANNPLFSRNFMPLSPEQVRRIAALARIELSEPETAAVREQLNGILGLIEQLQAVDTRGIEPMAHAGDVQTEGQADAASLRLREDRVTETDRRSLYQSVAPQVEQGLYLVPKVIE